MKLKENLDVCSSDVWYDLAYGGYLDPFKMCKNIDDANAVHDAVRIIKKFEQSCNEQIEGFEQ